MVTVRIGDEPPRNLSAVSDSWITQQINRRRQDGQNVCVEVVINTSGLNIRLATPGCGASGGGGRPPNANENVVLDLWNARRLSAAEFSPGSVVAFLKQLQQKLG